MLVYDNGARVRILFQIEGGVLWRTLPRGVLVAAATLGFARWFQSGSDSFWKPDLKDTWAADIFGVAISFAIVYRTQISWARYWEAAKEVHFMFSKWSDAFTQLISFIATAEKRAETDPSKKALLDELQFFRYRIAHDFSILSALATHRLLQGDLGRMRRRSDVFADQKCATARSLCRIWRHWDELIVSMEQLRYRDETDELPLFSVVELDSPPDVCLRAVSGLSKSVAGPTPQHARLGEEEFAILGRLNKDESMELEGEAHWDNGECPQPDYVNTVLGWINEDLNELGPLVGIPPPIMSRCYQELSNGMLGCTQATKMADIPFPFPFLQLMELLLILYTCLIPLYAAKFTGGVFSSPFLAMIVTMAFWSLSEISRELETPFAPGPNQLPVLEYHERFVDALRRIFKMRRPTGKGVEEEACSDAEPESPKVMGTLAKADPADLSGDALRLGL